MRTPTLLLLVVVATMTLLARGGTTVVNVGGLFPLATCSADGPYAPSDCSAPGRNQGWQVGSMIKASYKLALHDIEKYRQSRVGKRAGFLRERLGNGTFGEDYKIEGLAMNTECSPQRGLDLAYRAVYGELSDDDFAHIEYPIEASLFADTLGAYTNDTFAGVVAFVGAGCSTVSIPVQQLLATMSVPQLSWGSTSPLLTATNASDASAFPFFSRVCPSDAEIVKLWFQLMRDGSGTAGRWRNIATLNSLDVLHTPMFDTLQSILNSANEGSAASDRMFEVVASPTFNQNADPATAVSQLVAASDADVIVMGLYLEDARRVWQQVLVQTDGKGFPGKMILGDEVWTREQFWGTDASPISEAVRTATRGIIMATVNGDGGTDNLPSHMSSYAVIEAHVNATLGDTEPYMAYSYDAAWTVALAIDSLLAQGVTPEVRRRVVSPTTGETTIENERAAVRYGARLNDAIVAQDFIGATGRVFFDEHRSRRPSYRIDSFEALSEQPSLVQIGTATVVPSSQTPPTREECDSDSLREVAFQDPCVQCVCTAPLMRMDAKWLRSYDADSDSDGTPNDADSDGAADYRVTCCAPPLPLAERNVTDNYPIWPAADTSSAAAAAAADPPRYDLDGVRVLFLFVDNLINLGYSQQHDRARLVVQERLSATLTSQVRQEVAPANASSVVATFLQQSITDDFLAESNRQKLHIVFAHPSYAEASRAIAAAYRRGDECDEADDGNDDDAAAASATNRTLACTIRSLLRSDRLSFTQVDGGGADRPGECGALADGYEACNIHTVRVQRHTSSFLAGVAAGFASTTGEIGYIGERRDDGDQWRLLNAFTLGARRAFAFKHRGEESVSSLLCTRPESLAADLHVSAVFLNEYVVDNALASGVVADLLRLPIAETRHASMHADADCVSGRRDGVAVEYPGKRAAVNQIDVVAQAIDEVEIARAVLRHNEQTEADSSVPHVLSIGFDSDMRQLLGTDNVVASQRLDWVAFYDDVLTQLMKPATRLDYSATRFVGLESVAAMDISQFCSLAPFRSDSGEAEAECERHRELLASLEGILRSRDRQQRSSVFCGRLSERLSDAATAAAADQAGSDDAASSSARFGLTPSSCSAPDATRRSSSSVVPHTGKPCDCFQLVEANACGCSIGGCEQRANALNASLSSSASSSSSSPSAADLAAALSSLPYGVASWDDGDCCCLSRSEIYYPKLADSDASSDNSSSTDGGDGSSDPSVDLSSFALDNIRDFGDYYQRPKEIDAVSASDPGSIVLLIVASICMLLAILCVVLTVIGREHPEFRSSNPRILAVLCIGALCGFASVIPWLVETNDASCAARLWLFWLGFVWTTHPLFIKTYRIYQIIMSSTGTKSRQTSENVMFVYLGAVTALYALILAIWQGVDPLEARVNGKDVLFCSADEPWAWLGALCGIQAIFTVVAMYFALSLRRYKEEARMLAVYDESQVLVGAVYNTTLLLIVLIPVIVFFDSDAQGLAAVCSLLIIFLFLITLLIIYFPRAKRYFSDRQK